MSIFPDPDEATQRLLDDINQQPSNGTPKPPNDTTFYVVAFIVFACIMLGAFLRGCGLPDF